MNDLEYEIAQFLAQKAGSNTRTTYAEIAQTVGWYHPYGRGLGSHLYNILHELAESRHPPLTAILVRKGETYPHEYAMQYIREVYGEIDIQDAQDAVFAYDWSKLFPQKTEAYDEFANRDLWLTSFWGFDPEQWGCIGFANQRQRDRFLSQTKPGVLVAIYVTKNKGPKEMRGKVVGIYEISHEIGEDKIFLPQAIWESKETDPETKGKWRYAIQATRAWKIIPEQWIDVERIFPETYFEHNPQLIGSRCERANPHELSNLLALDIHEVPVYKNNDPIDYTIRTLDAALSPSNAVTPTSEPYMVSETDGPKYLYILKLSGNIAAYLGVAQGDVIDKSIVKVGFSKSPLTRRNQIQSAYPEGAYRWEVYHPNPIPESPPYQNAAIAIVGEDAMKARMIESGAKSLGGEFFLAADWLVEKCWSKGRYAADEAAHKNS